MLKEEVEAITAPNDGKRRSELLLRVGLLAALGVAIAADMLVPVDVNVAVLFAVVVGCAAFSTSSRFLWALTGAAALSSFGGYLGAGAWGNPPSEVILLNRSLGFLAIVGVGLLARAIQSRSVERNRLADAVSKERALLSTLVEHLPVGVIVVNRDGKPLFCNPAYTSIVPEGVLPSRLEEAADRWIGYHGDGQRIEVHDFVGVRALRGEDVTGTEFLHRSQDGRETWTRVSGVPIRDASGKVGGALCVVADIDEAKRAEESLRQLTSDLEYRVTERTEELLKAQESLRQLQKIESIGQLTGGVAHDFNNLLTPIVGALDLLQRNSIGTVREQRLIDGALKSAERAQILIQRLLSFARKQPLKLEPVDIGALVEGMIDLIRTTTGPRVHLELAIAADLPPAKGDKNQLEMAVLNLAVNARDAMPEGGQLIISASQRTVSENSHSRLSPGSYIVLAVADTGVGMDEQTLAKAVEPFFSTKGIGKGSGLGLSMVHGLAAQLGGELALTSKPGGGTNVELWFPEGEDLIAAKEPSRDAMPSRGGLGTVLLVDDEELVRNSTAQMLADIGYSVTEAASAEEALRLIDDGSKFDFVVSDHLMPGLTGAELARMLAERGLTMPVLIVSGYADLDTMDSQLPRLGKPFKALDLAVALEAIRNP